MNDFITISLKNLEYLLVLLSLLIAFFTLFNNSLMMSIILSGIYSLLLTLIYLLLDSPDVAMTEASVGACISTIFLTLVYYKVGPAKNTYFVDNLPKKLLLILTIIVSLIISYLYSLLPNFGEILTPANQNTAQYYLTNTVKETGVLAIVAAVLASYRGYDTLIETTVIFAGGIAVYAILSNTKDYD